MKIGILQTGHAPDSMRSHFGDYDALFEKLLQGQGFTFATYDVEGLQFPANVFECDGWLITGSKHGAYEDHAFIPPLEALIREIYASNVALVGVCFGHQIIAQALGGKVEKFAGGWAVGLQTYRWKGNQVALNSWHQDQVTALPEGAEVCGSNDFCAHAAIVYGQRAFTMQPHPEFSAAVVANLAEQYEGGTVPETLLAEVKAKLNDANDNVWLAQQMATFFKERKLDQ